MSFLAALGISAAGQLVNSMFNQANGSISANRQYAMESKLQEQQFNHNSQLMDKAYENQLNFWNQQNAYNTPAAQKARLQAAGYSPNFVDGVLNTAGGLSATPTSSVGMGSVGATGQSQADTLAGARAAADVSLVDAQRANIEADTALKQQQADTEFARLGLIENESALRAIQAEGQSIENELSAINAYIAGQTMDASVESVYASLDHVYSQTFLNLSGVDLNDARAQEALYNLAYIEAGVALRNMETELTSANIQLTDVQRAFILEQTAGKVLENENLQRELAANMPELRAENLNANTKLTQRRRTNETVTTWTNAVNSTLGTVLDSVGSFLTGGLSKVARRAANQRVELDKARTLSEMRKYPTYRKVSRTNYDARGKMRGGFVEEKYN